LRRRFTLLAIAIAFSATTAGSVAAQGRMHVLIVVGLGGAQEYRDSFHGEASRLYTALIDRHGLSPADVTYLGEKVEVDPEMISGRSTRANVLQELGEIAQRAGPTDRVLVVLIGHGTSARGEAQFNLPGPDLTPNDFQMGLLAFPTQSVALVNTASASGAFVAPLAGPGRIVVAATRTDRERNATEFGQFFVEAIAGEGADLDKDQRISLLEAFVYARSEVERYYEEQNELLTEHAVLDDNGDGEGSHDAGLEGPDGKLAATFHIGGFLGTSAQVPDDPALARLYEERTEIQGRIDELRVIREAMSEDDYLDAMEPILVELALKNREIRELEG